MNVPYPNEIEMRTSKHIRYNANSINNIHSDHYTASSNNTMTSNMNAPM